MKIKAASARNTMNPGTSVEQVLHCRWQHHRMHIRCGLSPHQPWRIAVYLQMGGQLAERGMDSPLRMQLRMLHTLLNTAADPVLKPEWRHLCLASAQAPLDWLRNELALHDPVGMQAVECAHQQAHRLISHREPMERGT